MSNGWLCLSRRHNESVMLGDDIEVKIAQIRGDKVRIAFRAPKEMPVHRREVYEAIKRRNRTTRQAIDEGKDKT